MPAANQLSHENLLMSSHFVPVNFQFTKNSRMRRKKSMFDKQYGFNLSDIQIQNPNHMSNGKKNKRSIIKHSKKLDKREKKSRRNYKRINNSKEFDVKLNNDGDERTTLMIRNIPNKYT